MSGKRVVLAGHRGRLVPAGQTVLEREGVEVVTVRTAAEVLQLLPASKPDLLVAGADLEDSTVTELCRAIRALANVRQPSILLIASPLERHRIEAVIGAGANGILPRPVDASAFDEVVGRLLTIPARRSFRVLVRVETSSGGVAFGESRNLSLTGMSLESSRGFERGEELDLSFFLPGERTEVKAHAAVVRAKPTGDGSHEAGLRFDQLPDDAELAIRRFVESRQRGRRG